MSTRTIYKYPITVGGSSISMPGGAEILSVQIQGAAPQLWALVRPGEPEEVRRFRVYGTGHDIPVGDVKYIGTFQMKGGALVFHLFEERP